MNRLGLKIICLVVSIVIWMQVASTSVVEQTTNLPLRVLGLGDNLTIAGSELPENIQVRVRGSKLALMNHNYFNEYLGEVRVNLRGRVAGPPFFYEINGKDVYSDLDGASINPPLRLRLHIDEKITRKLPVELVTSGDLPEGMAYLVDTVVRPDSILVTGPKRSFPEYSGLKTKPVDLANITSAQEKSAPITVLNELLELNVDEVVVHFSVAVEEDRTMANIPVVALVDLGTPDVAISPPVIDVMVRGVADSIQALTESRFLVTVPVGSRQEGIYSLAGQVDTPPWLTVIGLDPPVLQVIVGNPDTSDSSRVEVEVGDAVD